MNGIRRRTFIAGIGAAAWPLAAGAQQPDRMRRVGVLWPTDENDPEGKGRHSAFVQALADLGWTDGRNMRMDVRWYGDDSNQTRALAQELVGLQPDIILTGASLATAAVQRETRTISIVFANVGDPVASAIVLRLDRPGGSRQTAVTMSRVPTHCGAGCDRGARWHVKILACSVGQQPSDC